MMNDALYIALQRHFGHEPVVCNEGQPGMFSCPPVKRTRLSRNTKRYAFVEHWGECYSINCPLCGDTRNRLYFSHLYGQTTKQGTVTYYFGKLYRCQNEGCDLGRQLSKMEIPQGEVVEKPTKFVGIIQQSVELPKGCLPILSADVPGEVHQYLYGRHFDPQDLANKFFVHYAPKGTVWQEATEGSEEKVLYEDRLLIPVIQGRHLVGYQLRRLEDRPKDPFKYLNSSFTKSRCLYNRDVAMRCLDVVLCEGVTDVWRIGPHAMAMFGKDLNAYQIRLLKLLFGFGGRCLVCIDADDAKGQAKAEYLVERLRSEAVFPRGCAQLRLPEGYDPAKLPKSYLDQLQTEAWTRCI